MEAGEPARQSSGVTSSSNNLPDPLRFDRPSHLHQHRDSFDRSHRDGRNMATAALISPSTPYHPHHPPSFQSGFHHGPSSAVPGMISPAESRRTSDDHEVPHRQSLPSIQEVIGQKPPSFPPPQSGAISAAQSLPSPFSTSTPTRPFADAGDKNPSPRTLHPTTTTSFPRTESLPAFSDPARSSFSSRPPPLSTFAGPHPSPPVTMDQQRQEAPPPPPPPQQHEPDQRQAEGQQVNGGYHHPPPHVPAQVPYHPPGQLPPGQLPLSASYPISPRHMQPPPPSHFDSQRPLPYPDDAEFLRPRGNKYEATLTRHFEAWSYTEALARIGTAARTLFNFAEAYGTVAREEHAAQPIPARLPTEREISDMIHNADWVKTMLDNVRSVVQQSIINERAREGSRPKGPYDDEDVPMYNDGMKPAYSNPGGPGEVKKRRGRAAPPGRCHSCNRMDTPEWRRGPDGARTLCNACGLHYAKLERKRQLENRSLRPKPADEQQQQQQQQPQQQQPQQPPQQPPQQTSQPHPSQQHPSQPQPQSQPPPQA